MSAKEAREIYARLAEWAREWACHMRHEMPGHYDDPREQVQCLDEADFYDGLADRFEQDDVLDLLGEDTALGRARNEEEERGDDE